MEKRVDDTTGINKCLKTREENNLTMDDLDRFSIGWCSNSLLTLLKDRKYEKAKPFVPHVMRFLELSNGLSSIALNTNVLKNLSPMGQSDKLTEYKGSLKKLFNQTRINEEQRTELISFLESVETYCIQTAQLKPRYLL